MNDKQFFSILLFLFLLAVMLILRFTPNDKIIAMAYFFKDFLPRIPITDILKIFIE